MKKLVLFFAATVAVTFAACGNKASEKEVKDTVAVETITEEVVTPAVDSVAVDTTAKAVKK